MADRQITGRNFDTSIKIWNTQLIKKAHMPWAFVFRDFEKAL